MLSKTLTRRLGVIALSGALALTAACGSSTKESPDTKGGSEGSSSSESAEQQAGFKPMSKSDLGARVSDAIREAGTFHIVVNQDGGTGKAVSEGDVKVDGADSASHFTAEVQGNKVETIQLGGFIYVNDPSMKADKPWLKVDLAAKTGLGAFYRAFGAQSDPTESMKAFNEAAALKQAGKETVDGVETTKYLITVPSAALVKARKMPKETLSLLPKKVQYAVWVGNDDLTRKIESDITVNGKTTKITMLMTKFGDDVTIEAPPAGQTTSKAPSMGA